MQRPSGAEGGGCMTTVVVCIALLGLLVIGLGALLI